MDQATEVESNIRLKPVTIQIDSVTIQPNPEWVKYAKACGLSMEALCISAVQYFMSRDPLGVEAAKTSALEHQARQLELERRITRATLGTSSGQPGKSVSRPASSPAGETTTPVRNPVLDEEGYPAVEVDEDAN